MARNRSLLDSASNVAVILLCVLAAFAWVRVEYQARRNPAVGNVDVYRDDWRTFLASGTLMGHATAPVQVVALGDFECSGCRAFYEIWQSAESRFGDAIALTYVHYPLAYHRFALRAAMATECAKAQGRFKEMYSVLYEKQDSIGLKTVEEFAGETHIANIRAFRRCVSAVDTAPAILRGLALGKRIGLRGTPTLIVNGLQLGEPASQEVFFAMITRVIAGKPATR